MADPLVHWTGDFGDDYIDRNPVDDAARSDARVAFTRMLDDGVGGRIAPTSVLEVGANVGINLAGIRDVLPGHGRLAAVEPHPAAAATLGQSPDRVDDVVRADGARLPFREGAFELVFTNGVLIHVPPDRLPLVMAEIVRVSSKWVLCSEYFAHEPVEIPYRGRAGMLWKRDFGSAYLELAPELQVQSYGFLWQHELPTYDDLNWWLFRKA